MEPYYTTEEAAAKLRRHPGTLRHWRSAGRGPACVKVGGLWLYPESGLRALVESAVEQIPGGSAA